MNDTNDQLILVCGYSATGKSASLRNIQNQGKWIYLNTEAGKRLPFKNNFKSFRITDPLQVIEAFEYATEHSNEIEGIIVDSLTFLMDMYESQYVLTASNTMKAWSDYNQFFKTLMQEKVVKFGKPTIFIAHVQDTLDEKNMEIKTAVPIKELEKFKSSLLEITEEERELGFKYVFQTRITKNSTGERIRSPMGLFNKDMTYIDNDCQLLLNHLQEFYN